VVHGRPLKEVRSARGVTRLTEGRPERVHLTARRLGRVTDPDLASRLTRRPASGADGFELGEVENELLLSQSRAVRSREPLTDRRAEPPEREDARQRRQPGRRGPVQEHHGDRGRRGGTDQDEALDARGLGHTGTTGRGAETGERLHDQLDRDGRREIDR
jgi:hypothetical protein